MELAPRVGLQTNREWDSLPKTTRFQYLHHGKLPFPDPFPRFSSYSLKRQELQKRRQKPPLLYFGSLSWICSELLIGNYLRIKYKDIVF